MSTSCLIAANDPWFIQLIKAYALETGLRVIQAHEGQDVLPLIQVEHPAAVFLQADLPGKIQSKDIIKDIRRNAETNRTLVYVFSSELSSSEDEFDECEAILLEEPVTFDTFQSTLHKTGLLNLLNDRTDQ